MRYPSRRRSHRSAVEGGPTTLLVAEDGSTREVSEYDISQADRDYAIPQQPFRIAARLERIGDKVHARLLFVADDDVVHLPKDDLGRTTLSPDQEVVSSISGTQFILDPGWIPRLERFGAMLFVDRYDHVYLWEGAGLSTLVQKWKEAERAV
jgi:hypothetical protein